MKSYCLGYLYKVGLQLCQVVFFGLLVQSPLLLRVAPETAKSWKKRLQGIEAKSQIEKEKLYSTSTIPEHYDSTYNLFLSELRSCHVRCPIANAKPLLRTLGKITIAEIPQLLGRTKRVPCVLSTILCHITFTF